MNTYASDTATYGVVTTLQLKINGKIISEIPFGSQDDAIEFGREWVKSRSNHPAGKRRVSEPLPSQ